MKKRPNSHFFSICRADVGGVLRSASNRHPCQSRKKSEARDCVSHIRQWSDATSDDKSPLMGSAGCPSQSDALPSSFTDAKAPMASSCRQTDVKRDGGKASASHCQPRGHQASVAKASPSSPGPRQIGQPSARLGSGQAREPCRMQDALRVVSPATLKSSHVKRSAPSASGTA